MLVDTFVNNFVEKILGKGFIPRLAKILPTCPSLAQILTTTNLTLLHY
jgi:hypothetical protein